MKPNYSTLERKVVDLEIETKNFLLHFRKIGAHPELAIALDSVIVALQKLGGAIKQAKNKEA